MWSGECSGLGRYRYLSQIYGARISADAQDHRLAFERPVRSITDFAEALGVSYQGAANNINELIAQGVAEEVGGTYPKLVRFPGVLEALQVG